MTPPFILRSIWTIPTGSLENVEPSFPPRSPISASFPSFEATSLVVSSWVCQMRNLECVKVAWIFVSCSHGLRQDIPKETGYSGKTHKHFGMRSSPSFLLKWRDSADAFWLPARLLVEREPVEKKGNCQYFILCEVYNWYWKIWSIIRMCFIFPGAGFLPPTAYKNTLETCRSEASIYNTWPMRMNENFVGTIRSRKTVVSSNERNTQTSFVLRGR